jgi:RNA polymerase sigma factor (sigma-70 family)
MYRDKVQKEGEAVTWEVFLRNLYAPDWFLACACLERQPRAWQELFAARASRTDCLLVDALRLRAVRLFPRDVERQDEAVTEFWGYLLAGEREGALPILARYDGQRPLVPWLIRVFQNKHLSDLRHRPGVQPLPEEDLGERDLASAAGRDPFTTHAGQDQHDRWYEEFRQAAREWLATLSDNEVLILGLRLRYRLSQREVAGLLSIHEGNVSRQTARLRDHGLDHIGKRLQQLGWTGDDLSGFVFKEMDSVLLDEPRLAADRLAALLAARGKSLPAEQHSAKAHP